MGEEQDQVLSPPAATALDANLDERFDGYPTLVLAEEGTMTFPRLHRNHVAWTVRPCAQSAGIDKELTPTRCATPAPPSFSTRASPLRDVQVFMGHAHSTTTERYDLGRNTLDGSPAYRIAGVWSS